MTESQTTTSASVTPRPLRIWPLLALLALVAVSRIVSLTASEYTFGLFMFVMYAPIVATLGLLIWWPTISRATRRERWMGPLTFLLIAGVSVAIIHQSLRGMGFVFNALPTGLAAVLLTIACLRSASPKMRLWGPALAAIVGFFPWDFVRSDGMSGDFASAYHLRWTPTAEDELLASLQKNGAPATQSVTDLEQLANPAWAGFRGAKRDGIVPDVILDTDWQAHPPKEIWRRRIGPGWSSFAVAGNALFTQEQRGDTEIVVCYDADTGAERWVHKSPARFWESVAGAGPRATPTLQDGQLFSVGATGLVHCLNPATGEVIWERDLLKDSGREPLMWGFASSPLVVDDTVLVYAGGKDEKGVFAYDIKTGEPRWSVPAGDHSYSSPQIATVGGRDVVLMLTNDGLSAIDPHLHEVVWSYDWKFMNYRAIQPLVVAQSAVLLGTGMGAGTRCVEIGVSEATPQIKDIWTSLEIKPDFNDYVAHKGYLYGFDHNIFSCIDLETGKRQWKKGRYGNGQVLLLPAADQLLILAESGDVVVVRANPKNLEELARFKVLEGKTWNHPVLVGNRLYVRNGEEMACFEVPLVETTAETKPDGQ